MVDFKSISTQKPDTDVIENIIYHQYFLKRLSFDEDLKTFELDINNIDRIYHFRYETIESGYDLEFVVRFQDKSTPVYVQIIADFHYREGYAGSIFMSKDSSLFLNLILKAHHKDEEIYKLFREDGIDIEIYNPSEKHKNLYNLLIQDKW